MPLGASGMTRRNGLGLVSAGQSFQGRSVLNLVGWSLDVCIGMTYFARNFRDLVLVMVAILGVSCGKEGATPAQESLSPEESVISKLDPGWTLSSAYPSPDHRSAL